jgi:hypothetical protein
MSGAFQFAYGDPSNYSDWASYAGLDRKTGMFAASAPDTGVPPPSTMEEMWQQKAVAPAEKAFGNLKNTATMLGNTASQIGQGNVVGAYNASRGVVPVTPTPTTTQPALTTQPAPDWNLQSHID